MRKRVLSLITAICMLCGLVLNGTVLPVSASETDETVLPTVPFTEDFNDLTPGSNLPAGWEITNEVADVNSTAVVEDASAAGNMVMMLSQTVARDPSEGRYTAQYNFEPTDQAIVLEYRFKVSTDFRNIFLPVLTYELGSVPVALNVRESSILYSQSYSGWKKVAPLEADTWHTVREVVDTKAKACEVYLNGERLVLDSSVFFFQEEYTKLSGIVTSINQKNTGTLYIDDLSVSFAVPGESLTFEETAVTVGGGGGKYLKPVFTPEDTSFQTITYASSDESVATVDAVGMVLGIKGGTAIITATPASTNLAPVEITVTVEPPDGSISVPVDTLALPVGGHDFLNASIAFEGGFVGLDDTLKYESSAPEVATVDEWGEVLAVGTGTATITVRAMANLSITKEITVTVSEPDVMQTIYVAPNGTGDGSSAATPTSLDGAVALLAAIDKTNMTGNIEVILADGYYYRTETLALTDAHGGNNLYRVIFKAAEGANPTIGGGKTIEGSEFTDTNNDGIYEYELSGLNLGDGFNTRQLYVDSIRANRAGAPEVYRGTILKNAEYLYDTDGTTILGFICDNTELLDFARIQDLELVYKNSWIMTRCPVASVEEVDGRVHLIMVPEPFTRQVTFKDSMRIKPDNVVYYENALELLDEPGEWYFNVDTQVLYYMPRVWETMAEVTVTLPVFDNWDREDNGNVGLVTVIGSSSEQQVQNIRFEGITFADITWTRPDTKGLPMAQNSYVMDLAGKYPGGLADAAVTVKTANSVDFLDCTFTRLGGNGINMYDGVQNSLIQGCRFYDISTGAICIGQPDWEINTDNFNPTDPKKMMKNDDVLNNYIHDIGVEFQSSSAISMGFAADVDMCHNEIFNIPYSGFHIGSAWETQFSNITQNVNISENFVHDLLYADVYDAGGVYTLGTNNGDEDHWNVVSRNYFRNFGEKNGPLYSDAGSCWWKWTENVADTSENLKGAKSGAFIKWAHMQETSQNTHDILISGNYHTTARCDGASDTHRIIYENNTFVEDLNWPAEALEIMANAGLEAAYASLRNDQAERIITAAPDEGVDVSIGKTFDLNVRATDGKDKAVSLTGATVAYESMDESVATVDENGVITGEADGVTTVRVHVVSNGIWDVMDITVYVGDEVTELRLKNQESEISLGETSGKKNLEAYGITETGREVLFDKVTWSVADKTVATVDENGVLSPVAVGETELTVTGQKGDITKTVTYTVIVKAGSGFAVDYLDDIFLAENEDKWVHQYDAGTWELINGERITASFRNGKVYTGRTFENEVLTFRMSLTDAGGWPSIALRMPTADGAPGLGGTGYIFCFGNDGIELHRFNGSVRTQFYGSANDAVAIHGPAIKPNPLNDGELHEIQVGAINEGDAVRLVLYIDGVEIINILDDQEGAITDAGYFGLVGWQKKIDNVTYYDTFVLEYMGPVVEEEIEIKHNLTVESDIDFSFFVPKSAVAESGLTVTVVQDRADGFEDKSITLEQADWESATVEGVEYWRIRFMNVAAKEMTDKLTLTIQDASGTIATDVYSVAEYAKERIENSDDSAMKALMNAMLNYGAAAQVYFGYKTDDLANDGLATSAVASLRAATTAGSAVKHNLTLESNINFSFFVPKSAVAASGLSAAIVHDRLEGYDDKSITVAQAEWESLTSGGVEYWRIRYTDVAAKEIADVLTLTITDGTGTVITDAYSVLQYAQDRIENSSDENMKVLMQMLQTYGAAAQLYFEYSAAN